MKHQVIKYSTIVLSLLAATAAPAADWSGNVGVYLGNKTLDDRDWPQHDEHGAIGLISDFKKKEWPVSVAVDVFGTGDEDELGSEKHEVYTAEMHLGLRKTFKLPIEDCKLRPYVGGGVAFIHTEQKQRSAGLTSDYQDSEQGYWVGTGTYFRLNEHFNLGVDVRYSEADVRLAGQQREAGGLLVGFGAGYHW